MISFLSPRIFTLLFINILCTGVDKKKRERYKYLGICGTYMWGGLKETRYEIYF